MEGGGSDEVGKRDLQNKVRNNDPSVRLRELIGKSQILNGFMRVECDGANTVYASCKSCAVLVKYSCESGTSGLKRHTCKAKLHLTLHTLLITLTLHTLFIKIE